jgi:uncharacterized protein
MFEWDEEKRRHNIEQHGVDFYDTILIFENLVIEAEGTRREYRETHIQALGYVDDDYFIVVYTWRGTQRRIISGWKVDDNGKCRYQNLLS